MKQFYTFRILLFIAFAGIAHIGIAQKLHLSNVGSITGDGNQTCKIAADSKGFVYIAGSFTGTTLSFNGTTVPGNGNSIYLAKYDTSENLIWVKTYGGNATLSDIAIDKNSDIILGGSFSSSSSFDTYTLTSTGKQDIFYTKISSVGNVVWAKQGGGDSSDYCMGVSSDRLGNIYLCGNFFSDSFLLGGQQINLSRSGSEDCFYAKLDANGNTTWLKAPAVSYIYSINPDTLYYSLDKIKAADDGSVYLSGSAAPYTVGQGDTLSFTALIPSLHGGPTYDQSKGAPPFMGFSTAFNVNFIVKLDANGTTLKQFIPAGFSRGSKEVNFGFHQQYLYTALTGVGLDYHIPLVQKSDTATALIPDYVNNFQLLPIVSDFTYIDATDMALDKTGNVYTAISGQVGAYTELLLVDSNLNFLDSLQLRLPPVTTIAVDTSSHLSFFAGTYTSTQPYTIGTDVLPSTAGNTSVFFIKTRNTPKPVSIKVNDTVTCAGQTTQLHALVSGGYPSYTYSWKPATGLSDSTISNPIVSSTADSTQYIITVTDSIGATATDTAMVYVNPVPTLTVANPTPVCAPATIDLSSPTIITSGTQAGIQLNYFKDPAATDTLVNPTHVDSSGTYYIKASSSLGCNAVTVIKPVTVTINPQPGATINANGPTTFCIGDSVTLTASSALSHLWATGGYTDTSSSIVVKVNGYVELTNKNSYGCQTLAPAIAITVLGQIPTVSVAANTLTSITFNWSSPGATSFYLTYQVNHGTVQSAYANYPQSSYTVNNLTPGDSVIMNVLPSGSCSKAGTTTGTTLACQLITTTIPSDTTVCNGGIIPAVAFTSSPDSAIIHWTNSDPSIGLAASGTGNIPSFTAINTTASPKIATISITPSVSPCNGTAGIYHITVNPDASLVLTSAPATTTQTVCANSPITPITYAVGGTGVTISSLPSGVSETYAAGVVTISGAPNTAVGSPFSYSVTTTGSCAQQTLTGTITVNPMPSITLDSTQCATDLLSYSIYTTTSAGTLTSNMGTVTNLSSNKWMISGIASYTNATLTLISNGCSATQLVTSPNCANCPSVSAPVSDGDQTACAQTPVQTLTATASAPTGYTIRWYDSPFSGNIVASPTLSVIGRIIYYAEADGISSPICHSITRTPVTLSIVAPPVLLITDPAPVCVPATVDITSPVVTTGSIFPSGTILTYYTDIAGANTLANPNNISINGTYYIKASTPDICTAIEPVTVVINQDPATPLITQTNDTLISNVTLGNHWYENGLLLSGENTDTLQITQSGFYAVRIIDNTGCYSDSASIQVIVPANRPAVFTHQEFPNPATNVLNISYSIPTASAVGITLEDINGKEVSILLEKQQEAAGSYQLSINNLTKLPGGTYFVHYSINNKDIAEKVIIL